jgi:hypothetical protein
VSDLARSPLRLLLVGLLVACGGGGGATATTVLSWDAVADPNVAGYRLYVGTAPGSYDQPGTSVGYHHSHAVAGLSNQTTYYFAVTAYDFLGNESAFSNEVSKTTP